MRIKIGREARYYKIDTPQKVSIAQCSSSMAKSLDFFIIGERDKNGNETIIPLFKFPYALTIIQKYGSGEEAR